MTKPVYIVATEARTPFGLNAAQAAAAVRAGITALAEHPFMIDQIGNLMLGACDTELDPCIFGVERMLTMAETAIRETCLPLAEAYARRIQSPPLPVFLGLPEFRPGFTETDAEALSNGLRGLRGLPIPLANVHVFPGGHSAGFAALDGASRAIQQGVCEICLVGGVESYFHPDTMEWLDKNRQLAGEVSRSGFIPGEGAAFCLVMGEDACTRLRLKPITRVKKVSLGTESKLIKTSEMCFGEGLSEAVEKAVAALNRPGERINQVICDMNGERYRGEEWGFVCLRLSQYFDDPTTYHSPAECWGDMGAASGPLFVMLACHAIRRGHTQGSRTMLWASSEGGQRGVAILENITDSESEN